MYRWSAQILIVSHTHLSGASFFQGCKKQTLEILSYFGRETELPNELFCLFSRQNTEIEIQKNDLVVNCVINKQTLYKRKSFHMRSMINESI